MLIAFEADQGAPLFRVVYPRIERDFGEDDGTAVQLAGRAIGGEAVPDDGCPLVGRELVEGRAEPGTGAPAQVCGEERGVAGERQVAIGERSDQVGIVAGRPWNHHRDERSEHLVQ